MGDIVKLECFKENAQMHAQFSVHVTTYEYII